MMCRKYYLVFVLLNIFFAAAAQDTLPKFSVINKGNDRIIISWVSPYEKTIRQLSIQRSFDSLKNFKTILTVPDPTVLQNGYVDTKAMNDHMFYRLYILRDSGKYLFSIVKRPISDNANTTNFQIINPADDLSGIIELNKLKGFITDSGNATERIIFIKKKDIVVGFITERSLKSFRDYVNYNTRDTLLMKASDTIVIKPFVARDYFIPSRYVFTEKDGNIKILLNDAASKKYAVKFFEEGHSEVFEIKHIKEPLVIVDKTNFIHSGWFTFELYDDGKLKEKHKFYVPKDF